MEAKGINKDEKKTKKRKFKGESMNDTTSRREYFTYRGVKYGIGTKVLLSDIGCKKHYISQLHRDKPLEYGFTCDGCRNIFGWIDERGRKYGCSDATIHDYDLEIDIKEIVKPVYVELVSWQKKAVENMVSSDVYADIFGGVIIYIAVMLIGTIFYERFMIWATATVIFVVWLLNQYRD